MSQNDDNHDSHSKESKGEGVPLGAAKGWFLTYPQCTMTKEVLLKHLDEKFTGLIKEYVICQEHHQDGNPHLHAYVKFKNQKRIRSRSFDFEGFHGNYQTAKSWKAVCGYVIKYKDYISSFDVKSALAKKGKMKKEDLLKDVDQVLDEGLITPMQVASFYRNSMVYKMLQNKRKKMPEVMPEKKRHLWIYGPSNTGKTTKLREQMREKGEENFFQIPTNNDWIGYDDQYYLYLDEYKGQLTIQQLNRICDGGAKVNVKGGTVQLRYDVQVIIISNYSIAECYNKADSTLLDSLNNRFNETYSVDYLK
jgi:hypothetical protein